MAEIRPIRCVHLYPAHLNLYGDYGNLIALEQRARWREIPWQGVVPIHPGQPVDFSDYDLVFIGGGQDQQQRLVADDLVQDKASSLRREVELGLVVLAVCGGFQLLGRKYITANGEEITGAGLFPAETEAGEGRLIGNVLASCTLPGVGTLVGFENHSGRTWLDHGAEPLAHVECGFGNNGQDKGEGIVHGTAIGTYLHGSLLPKNPRLTDWLLGQALRRQGLEAELAPLDDRLEEMAHQCAADRAKVTAMHAET